ncbi:MAG: sulfite exporter TauE/SafE family protein [Candidatus Micrarchaeota archaeon]
MDMLLFFIIIFLLSCLFTVLGLGGAAVYVPIFFWLGIPLDAAIASALFTNIIATGISSYNYYINKLIDFKITMWIVAGTLLCVPVGVWFSTIIPVKIIFGLFALFLFLGAARTFFGKFETEDYKTKLKWRNSLMDNTALKLSAIGGLAGIAGGTLGVGGGILIVPLLTEMSIPLKKIVVLTTFTVFFASLAGFVGHATLTKLDYFFLFIIGLAAMLGAFFGSTQIARDKIKHETIRKAFAILLFIFGLKFAWDFLFMYTN